MLSPSHRSAAGYRLYGPEDAARLARICRFRRVGLPLALIRDLLEAPDADLAEALATRLADLDEELRRTREQQRSILKYLYGDRRQGRPPVLTLDRFVEMLDLAGVSMEHRRRLHRIFGQAAAEEHRAFLAFFGVGEDDVGMARCSRSPGGDPDSG